MSTTKPSVTRQFNDVVFPEMKKDGFVKLSTKLFARLLEDEILQWVSLYVDGSLRRHYYVEYGTMLISVPRENLVKTLGGDFKKGASGGSYGALNERMLDESIQRVLIAYQQEVRPILSRTSSLDAFIRSCEQLASSSPHLGETGHMDFDLACAFCLNGKPAYAIKHCKAAQMKYEIVYSKNSASAWALKGSSRAKLLLSKLGNSSELTILAEWKKQTIDALKINKLLQEINS